MCEVDDGERCAVWDVTYPRARKPYRCAECGLPILPGIQYDRIASLFDGRWSTTRVHPECHALVRYIAFDVCGQQTYSLDDPWMSFRERIREHMGESPEVLRMYRDILRVRNREARAAVSP